MSLPPPNPKKKRRVCFTTMTLIAFFCLLGMGAIGFLASLVDSADTTSPKAEGKSQQSAPETHGSRESFIPGIAAVDVYGNLMDRGFTVTRDYGKSMVFWKCEDNSNSQVYFRADVTAKTATQLIYVSATVMNFGTKSTDDLAMPFLEFFSTLPHRGSNPEATRKWVEQHINDIGASTHFGEVVYSISGNDRSRILQLRHKKTTP